MNEFTKILPRYLHLPYQYLWFDVVEWGVVIISYLVGMILGGWFYLSIIIVPLMVIPYKRSKDRGYFNHVMYENGLTTLEGYPPPTAKEFNE